MEKLKGTINRTVSGAQLRTIYELLDDEQRPYDAVVRSRVKPGKHLITMSIRPEDKPYFQNLFNTAANETK